MSNALFNYDNSYNAVCGCDEAGRGPAAGAVFAAAVYFNDCKKARRLLKDINDSKKLSEKKREILFEQIVNCSLYSVAFCSVEQIEQMNILNASLFAMHKAVTRVLNKCIEKNITVLVDGNKKIKNYDGLQTTIVKGDSKSASIAAASVLAKVARDRYMKKLALKFPEYNWEKNKGYLTQKHIEAIKNTGLTPQHRKKFVRNIFIEQKKLF